MHAKPMNLSADELALYERLWTQEQANKSSDPPFHPPELAEREALGEYREWRLVTKEMPRNQALRESLRQRRAEKATAAQAQAQ